MKFCIYENDLRQEAIAEALVSKGCIKLEFEDVSNADVVILPFINVSNVVNIDDEYVKKLKPECIVFTGAKDNALRSILKSNNIRLVELMLIERMAIFNSVPTAEGTIYNILNDFDKCIFNSKILVVGYGVCGSEIVRKLVSLGANVDIVEVCKSKKSIANIRGIASININQSELDYDVIINTVPSRVFSESDIQKTPKNTLVYDIASSPFGFDEDFMLKQGINYKILKGLPSKFGVKFSANNISEFIINGAKGVV